MKEVVGIHPQSVRTSPSTALSTSLRCLVHPATLLSIALLLLNDHLLKAVAPSWLTGKLSDFAGLFFFPFLLAALLTVLPGALRRLTPMTVGRTAFSIAAVWFAAAKATPLGQELTAQFVSAVLGYRVFIAVDPTDLIGLVVLWPAWRLWRRQAIGPPREAPVRAGWPVLLLAVLASVATSPPYREWVPRLVVTDNEMYALTKYDRASDLVDSDQWRAYKASDNGRSWSRLHSIPEPLQDDMARPLSDVVVARHPDDPQMRYRVKGEGKVEYSEDGGDTWQTAWRVPEGRRRFMERYYLLWSFIDIGPYDVAFTPDGSGTLVVALGTEGVLVRDPDGTWSRYAVGEVAPTPFSTLNPLAVLRVLWFEGLVLAVAVLLVASALSLLAWVPILRSVNRARGQHSVGWAVRPVLLGLLLLAANAVLVTLPLSRSILGLSIPIGFLILPLVALIVLVLWLTTWNRVIEAAGHERSARRSCSGCAWTTVGLLVASGLPLVLWVAGVISWYRVALYSAIVLGLAVVGIGAVRVHQASRAAAGRREVTSNRP